MNKDERNALRTLARAVREGEAALEVVRAAKLDTVAPVAGLVERLRELREVNERRLAAVEAIRSELAAVGVDELKSRWPHFATVGVQLLALVGK